MWALGNCMREFQIVPILQSYSSTIGIPPQEANNAINMLKNLNGPPQNRPSAEQMASVLSRIKNYVTLAKGLDLRTASQAEIQQYQKLTTTFSSNNNYASVNLIDKNGHRLAGNAAVQTLQSITPPKPNLAAHQQTPSAVAPVPIAPRTPPVQTPNAAAHQPPSQKPPLPPTSPQKPLPPTPVRPQQQTQAAPPPTASKQQATQPQATQPQKSPPTTYKQELKQQIKQKIQQLKQLNNQLPEVSPNSAISRIKDASPVYMISKLAGGAKFFIKEHLNKEHNKNENKPKKGR